MAPPSPHRDPDAGRTDRENEQSSIRISMTVVNRFTFDTDLVTGREIKESTGVPAGFALYRRTQGGNEPIPDDERVELHNGDHFFARSASSPP